MLLRQQPAHLGLCSQLLFFKLYDHLIL